MPRKVRGQLRLLEPVEDTWQLDERTKEIGRAGVRAARQALRTVTPAPLEDAASPAWRAEAPFISVSDRQAQLNERTGQASKPDRTSPDTPEDPGAPF